jgi:uncharacterized membrane protein
VVRAVVAADIAFGLQAVWTLAVTLQHGLSVVIFIPFAVLWGLADLGAWDLDRAALKARLLLGSVGIVLAIATPLLRTDGFDEYFREFILGIAYWIAFLAVSVASVVVSVLALRATRPLGVRRTVLAA